MQIFTNIPEQSLDAIVVIPAFNEDVEILPTLYSLHGQRVDSIRFGVFVVVNNPPEVAREILESNRRTLSLMHGIIDESNVDIFLEEDERIITDDIEMPNMLLTSARRALHEMKFYEHAVFGVVDVSTDEHTEEGMNVGMARAIADQIGPHFFDPDSDIQVYITGDADTIYPRTYIQGGLDFLVDQNRMREESGLIPLGAFRGRVDYLQDEDKERWSAHYQKLVGQFNKARYLLIRDSYGRLVNFDTRVGLSGATSFIPRSVYEEVGGFRPLSWGEEGDLALRIMEAGYDVMTHTKLPVLTSVRCSDRTERGFGQGFNSLYGVDSIADVPVRTFEVEKGLSQLYQEVGVLDARVVDFEEWQSFFSRHFFECLPSVPVPSNEVMRDLYEACKRGPRDLALSSNPFFVAGLHDYIWSQSAAIQPYPEAVRDYYDILKAHFGSEFDAMYGVLAPYFECEGRCEDIIDRVGALDVPRGKTYQESMAFQVDEDIAENLFLYRLTAWLCFPLEMEELKDLLHIYVKARGRDPKIFDEVYDAVDVMRKVFSFVTLCTYMVDRYAHYTLDFAFRNEEYVEQLKKMKDSIAECIHDNVHKSDFVLISRAYSVLVEVLETDEVSVADIFPYSAEENPVQHIVDVLKNYIEMYEFIVAYSED